MFQSTVSLAQGAGVAGQLYSSANIRAKTATIVSDPVVNKIGNACTVTSEGIIQMGGSGVFAGFLMFPQEQAAVGSGGDPLAPTITLPDQTLVGYLQEGEIYVNLTTAGNIGDSVIYEITTGNVKAIAPDAALPVGWLPAWAEVSQYTLSSAGLAVAHVNKSPVINVP